MALTWLAAAIGGAALPAVAAEPYAGKQIRMVIASGTGYDICARFLARHLSRAAELNGSGGP